MGKPIGLVKFDVDKMIKLRKMGYTFKDIGKKFGISESSVRYHLNPHYKILVKKSAKIQKQNPEYKKKTNEKYKKRYHSEPEFRKKHIERSKRYHKENPDKKKQYNDNYLNKKKMEKTKKQELVTVLLGLCVLLMTSFIIVYIVKYLLLGG